MKLSGEDCFLGLLDVSWVSSCLCMKKRRIGKEVDFVAPGWLVTADHESSCSWRGALFSVVG